MDPVLILFVVVGAAVGAAKPLSARYLRYLYVQCPANTLRMEQKGEPEKAIRHLEWVLSRRTKMPEVGRVSARYALASMYLREKRFSEAEAQLRPALSGWRDRKVNREDGTLETLLRLDLAQSLEAQGDKDGAETERDLATQSLLEAKKREWAWHLLRAADLMRREQYGEAVTEYKIGLHELPVHVPADQRGAEMLNIATCLMKLERTTDALRYLEQSLDSAITPQSLPAVHHLAGQQCFKLNRLEDAERHFEAAIQAHGQTNTPDADSQIEILRLQIGIARLMRGDLDAARQTVSYLYGLSSKSGNASAELLALDLAVSEGHFSLSLDHIRRLREFRHDDSSVSHSQSLPEMDVALGNVAADLYLSLNEPQKALSELEAVEPADEGITRWFWKAIHIRVLSQIGKQSDADKKAELQEQTLKLQRLLESDFTRRLNEGAQPEDAAAALRQPTISLAYTAFAVGMNALALQLCRRYQEMSPYAVNLPGIYCLIGECHAALDNRSNACAAWRTAVSFGIDTHRARIAAEHLTALQNAG